MRANNTYHHRCSQHYVSALRCRDKNEIERDEIAGRVKILEAPEVKVDEFGNPGERKSKAIVRTGERLYQEYDSKVNEVSYDSCTITYVIILIIIVTVCCTPT